MLGEKEAEAKESSEVRFEEGMAMMLFAVHREEVWATVTSAVRWMDEFAKELQSEYLDWMRRLSLGGRSTSALHVCIDRADAMKQTRVELTLI